MKPEVCRLCPACRRAQFSAVVSGQVNGIPGLRVALGLAEGEAPLAEGLRDNEWARGFTVFAREIIGALREGRTHVEGAATFDDGHRTQLVLDAARAAHASGCRVTVGE